MGLLTFYTTFMSHQALWFSGPFQSALRMLLTVYYVAATWLQSWRLNSMRTKLIQLRKNKSSLLIFKSQEVTLTPDGKIIF